MNRHTALAHEIGFVSVWESETGTEVMALEEGKNFQRPPVTRVSFLRMDNSASRPTAEHRIPSYSFTRHTQAEL